MKNFFLLLTSVVALAAPALHAQAGEFDCVIEPRQVIEIRSPVEGLIEKLHVDRGEPVRKGQVIAELDASVERAAAAMSKQRAEMEGPVRSATSRVTYTERRLARAEELRRENFLSAEALDQARTEHGLAQAELRDALDNRRVAEYDFKRQMEIIRLKTIRSPIDGVVLERILNVGELAESGVGRKPIFRLAELGTLYVETVLPVEAYGKVKPGMVIEVTPHLANGGTRRATVKVVDPALDAASGTFGVRLELPNPQRRLPSGVRCTANFPGIEAAPSAGVVPRPAALVAPRPAAPAAGAR